MGKNKAKKNSVFKVAGAKSFKSKQKAKAVNTKLKDIKVKVRDQIAQMDKDLLSVQVQDKIHQITSTSSTSTKKPSPQKNQAPKPSIEEQSKAFEKMQTDKEQMLESIEKFTLTNK